MLFTSRCVECILPVCDQVRYSMQMVKPNSIYLALGMKKYIEM